MSDVYRSMFNAIVWFLLAWIAGLRGDESFYFYLGGLFWLAAVVQIVLIRISKSINND